MDILHQYCFCNIYLVTDYDRTLAKLLLIWLEIEVCRKERFGIVSARKQVVYTRHNMVSHIDTWILAVIIDCSRRDKELHLLLTKWVRTV